MPDATISELWCYPVKSMAGGAVAECALTTQGVVGDRRYAVVDRGDGSVASAKHPHKWKALLHLEARYLDPPIADADLSPVTVTFPDGSSVRSDEPGIDAALSRYTGRDVTLTSVVPPRPTFEEVWPEVSGLAPDAFIAKTATGRTPDGETISSIDLASLAPGTFLDLAPLHLLTEATLAELTALVPEAGFDRRRYRPNIVLRVPGTGFVENGWVGQSLFAGAIELPVLLATMRCVMTTLAQPGLPEDRETLRGIARHNRVEIPGLGAWACAGVYAGVSGPGRVAVGDRISLPA
ncbi:MAG: MOSC domain-containing protein [Acidimicrobiales bacterium]